MASDAQKVAIDQMRSILEKNGWRFQESKSWRNWWNVFYAKGLREIHIYPYDWGPGCTGIAEDGYNSCKLFVVLR
ncbi:hypothetical protein HYW73_03530 [Candidatus Nomurabacteria bacterium]|nr:hypothetical protein [Candidatus Nomurabacteria bacterium]